MSGKRFAISTALCICIHVFLAGCRAGTTPPTITLSPTRHPLLTPVIIEPTPIPTATATPIEPTPPVSSDTEENLEIAVANLLSATSFEMSAHEIRAYQIIEANVDTRQVYGEFNTEYTVIRSPQLNVNAKHAYRYDPQDDFFRYDLYTYQENDQYFTQLVENTGTSDAEVITTDMIEPFASDIYRTLVTYSNQSKFVAERNGFAVYILEHPEWYVLKGAAGFADLGFLYMQENGESLVEQYVEEHYANVKTIVFTIYVAVDEKIITRVEVDDRDFMTSLWAEIDRAAIAQGADADILPRYVIMDENGSEYLFFNYNQAHVP